MLRLPPYHYDLNSMEMVLSQTKQYTKARNTTFKIKDVDVLTREAITNVMAEQWDSYCRVEVEMWRLNGIIDAFVIENPNDSEDDSGSSSDSDSNATIIKDYTTN